MPAPLTMPLPANAAPARRSDAGFSVLELIIVMLIILILIAVAVSTLRGTKRTGQFRAAQAAAHSYAEAVESYMADNGQTPPVMGPAPAGWPTTTRKERIGGPIDPLLQNKRYLPRAAPEAVSDGLVDLITPAGGPAPTPLPSARATITYERTAANYTFTVRTVGVAGEPVISCVISNAITIPAGSERCA